MPETRPAGGDRGAVPVAVAAGWGRRGRPTVLVELFVPHAVAHVEHDRAAEQQRLELVGVADWPDTRPEGVSCKLVCWSGV